MVVRRLPSNELYHHGIKGQKWGVRRYQNADGSLTQAGKDRYGTTENFEKAQKRKKIAKTAAITAGVTLAAAAAYVATNKQIKKYIVSAIRNSKLNNVRIDSGRKYVTNNIFQKTPQAKRLAFNKKIDAMDDKTLEKAINRLRQEKTYRNLYNEKIGKVHINYDDIMNRVANATIYASVAGLTGYGLRAAITGKHDREMLADYVAPRPKNKK